MEKTEEAVVSEKESTRCDKCKSVPFWKCRRKRKWCVVLVFACLVLLYAVAYGWRFGRINQCHGRENVMVSDLPKECQGSIECYGDPPEKVDVWMAKADINDDGVDELILDPGPYVRGASNCWYAIWEKQPSGLYKEIGSYYCDVSILLPSVWIFGYPSIWCISSTDESEVVRWKDNCYQCLRLGRE